MPDDLPKSAPRTAFSILPAASLRDLAGQAEDLARAALSPATRRAYETSWGAFDAWCRAQGLESLPAAPEALSLYLAWLAPQKSIRTVGKVLAAVALAHRTNGHPSPTEDPHVRLVVRGLRRTYGKPAVAKEALRVGDMVAMVRELGPELLGLRDRALLLLGFAGAFRRSELVALDVEDLKEVPEGLVVLIRRSKTDPEGEGRKVGIPRARRQALCPVAAVKAWTSAAGIETGPLFRPVDRWGKLRPKGRLSDRAVAIIVQRAAEQAGLDASTLSGHSLRSGFCTEAARAGASERAIMAQTGHKSASTLRGYIRDGGMFFEHPGEKLL
jgi:site-specific recombinase XerD